MNELIVNADDLGLSQSVNRAIVDCLDNGVINSASIMPNMPFFEEAACIVSKTAYLNCIGVHVNLTEGQPLTDFKQAAFLNKDGTWNKKVITNHFNMGFPEQTKKEFTSEILAQIDLVKKRGIQPTHINSHHHIHTLPAFFPIFFNLCRTHNYKLRIAQTNSSGNFFKNLYRNYMNNVIKKNRLNFSDYFETAESYSRRRDKLDKGIVEIMVHPSYNDENKLIDVWDNQSLRTFLKN